MIPLVTPGLEGLFDGLYALDLSGDQPRVWSYPRTWKTGKGATVSHSGKHLAMTKLCGYYRVCVYGHDKKQRTLSVARLVAEAVIGNPLRLPQVNHIDGNRINNRPENLEWVTPSQNSKHSYSAGLHTEATIIAARKNIKRAHAVASLVTRKLTDDEVADIRRSCAGGVMQLEMAKRYAMHPSAISLIVSGRIYKRTSKDIAEGLDIL